MKKVNKVARKFQPKKSGQIPATKAMLYEVKYELKHGITEVRLEMRAGFKRVDATFKGVDSRFNEVGAQFKRVDARFNEVGARFKEVDARFDKVDARFKDVDARFDRVDERFDKMDASLLDIKADIQKVLEAVHGVRLFVEEQKAQNIFVIDGHTNLHDRVSKLEACILKSEA